MKKFKKYGKCRFYETRFFWVGMSRLIQSMTTMVEQLSSDYAGKVRRGEV